MRWLPLVLVLFVAADDPSSKTGRPIRWWAAGPIEVRGYFDPPLDAESAKKWGESQIGRAIVMGQGRTAEKGPTIGGVGIEHSGRILVVATDPHAAKSIYAVENNRSTYDLSGIEVVWSQPGKDAAPEWSEVFKDFTLSELETAYRDISHPLKDRLKQPGRLIFKTSVVPPKGKGTLILRDSVEFAATIDSEDLKITTRQDGSGQAEAALEATGDPFELRVAEKTKGDGKPPALRVTWKPKDGPEIVPQFQLSWVPPLPPGSAAPPLPISLEGGDVKRGEEVFRSEAAKCAACHIAGAKGGVIGPNLDQIPDRRAADLYRNIAEPSAVIHPNYLTYTVASKDGRIAVGIVRAEGFDKVKVSDIGGQSTSFAKSEIDEMRSSMTSTMPVGLAGALGEEKMRDLITFLMAGGGDSKSSKPE